MSPRGRRSLSLVAVFVVALLAGGCDWAQYGFDSAHTGANPLDSGIDAGNVTSLSTRWRTSLRDPIVVGGMVLGAVDQMSTAPFSSRISALDAATGTVRWSTADVYDDLSGPVRAGDSVYATTLHSVPPVESSALNAYDADTGELRWSVPLADCPHTSQLRAPTVASGLVIVTDRLTGLCAIDDATGKEVWFAPLPSPASPAAVAAGRVFVYGESATPEAVDVAAFDVKNGQPLWSRDDIPGMPRGAPVVSNGRLFVPAGTLSTFDAATGAPGWTATGEDVSITPDSVVSTEPGAIRSLDATTGAVKWSIVGPAGTVYAKAAVANGIIFVGSHIDAGADAYKCCAHLSALDARTGGELFSFPTQLVPPGTSLSNAVPTVAIVSGGVVYLDVGYGSRINLRNVLALAPAAKSSARTG